MEKKAVRYYYEAYGNRDLPEDEQGYADIIPLSAAELDKIGDEYINAKAAMGEKKGIKLKFGEKSLQINKKHCPKVFNVIDPLYDEKYEELDIEEVYRNGQFNKLYKELSEAINDMSQLKEGLKKS